MKILVIVKKDYADEFDCEMFMIFNSESIDVLRRDLKNAAHEIEGTEIFFGTNEWNEASSSDFDEKFGCATFKEIPDAEADIIAKYLGGCYGTGHSYLDRLADTMEGKEEA